MSGNILDKILLGKRTARYKLRKWRRNKLAKYINGFIPGAALAVDLAMDDWIDELQEGMDAWVEQKVRERLPDGVIEDAAVAAYAQQVSPLVEDFIDDWQEAFGPDKIAFIMAEALDRLLK